MEPELLTDRLILRRWRDDDRILFREMNADPVVMEYFLAPLSPAESDGFADRIQAEFDRRGWGLWAVEPREGGGFIGFIGFHEATFESPFTPAVEIGWRLARSAWGRGYATEGARRCLEEGFGRFGFDDVVSFAPAVNRRSINVMEKIGLSLKRDFDHPALPEGHDFRPHHLYGLTRTAFFESLDGTAAS